MARAAMTPTSTRAAMKIKALPPLVELSITALRPRTPEMMYSVATACFWFMPMSMSLWWMWPRSAVIGLWPRRMRRMKAAEVSKIGRPRMRKGTRKEITA